jgi:hypothetical protein
MQKEWDAASSARIIRGFSPLELERPIPRPLETWLYGD